MAEVLTLALPFFGLIIIGFVSGKLKKIPEAGLAWMNFFLIYISLPALFYRILAQTPLEKLNNPPFVIGTTLATFGAFATAFVLARLVLRDRPAEASLAAFAGGYGNIGYMGPGLAIGTLGAGAAVPVALIFCFDNMLLFTLIAVMMAVYGRDRQGFWATVREILVKIFTHPFILATFAGVAAAIVQLKLPQGVDQLLQFLASAAAPCALFVLGVTVALRPFEEIDWEVPIVVAVKLLFHPFLVLLLLSLLGPFDKVWVYAAVLLAALPQALNVFITARQYDVWVREASSSVLLGTGVSLVTLTLIMYLVKTETIPATLFP